MPQLVVLPAARGDLLDQAPYYDSHGGEALGNRFLRQCAAFARLLRSPERGASVLHRHPRLVDCRFVPVRGFDAMLIFYRLTADQIQIVRLLHGARDIEAAFSDDDRLNG